MTYTNTDVLELVIAAADDDPRVPTELDTITDWESFGRRAFELLTINHQTNRAEPSEDSTHQPSFWATLKALTDVDDLEFTAEAIAAFSPHERDRALFTALAIIRIFRSARTRAHATQTWVELIRDEHHRAGYTDITD